MDDLSKLHGVITLLYESVLDESRWTEAMQALAEFSAGHAAGHFLADAGTGTVLQCETVSIDPVFRDLYMDRYAALDLRVFPAMAYPIETAMTEGMLIDRRELERSEVYGEVLLPSDVPHFMMTWVNKNPQVMETFVIEGNGRRGAFDRDELARFSMVIPHLTRAMKLRNLVGQARELKRVTGEALDALPFGFIFLGERGEIADTNRMADDLLTRGAGLTVKARRFVGTRLPDDRQLQALIAPCLKTPPPVSGPFEAVAMARAEGTPLQVYVVPVGPAERPHMSDRIRAIVFVVDPDRAPAFGLRLLQETLNLSKAEAQLATALYTGVTLREAAQQLGLSINTCKTQLKSIYAKTGCRNHVDLAKKLMFASLEVQERSPRRSR